MAVFYQLVMDIMQAMTFKQLRRILGLSQSQVAKLTLCTVRTVQRWESEQSSVPKPVIELLMKKLKAK